MEAPEVLTVKNRKDLAALVSAWNKILRSPDPIDRAIAIDTETYAAGEKKKLKNEALVLDRGRIMIITACHKNKAWFIPLKAYWSECLPDYVVTQAIGPLLENQALRKAMWNANYDVNMFRNHGVVVKNAYCGMIAGHVWNNELPMSLKERSVLIGMRLKKYTSVDQGNIDEFGQYAVNDAVATWKLYEGYERGHACTVETREVDLKLNKSERYFFELEMRALKQIIAMERRGMKVDIDRLNQIDKEIAARMDTIKIKLYRKNEAPFNVASTKQLGEFLYEKLGLSPPHMTAKGKPSVDKLALIHLQEDHPLVKKIIEHNKLQALKKFTGEGTGLQNYADEKHRIHSTISQCGTRTFRSSDSKPNLQQIPSKTDTLGFRKSFIPEKGNKLIIADMDQLELRLMCLASRDKMMLKAFKSGASIHIQTGILCGLLDPKQTKEEMKKDRKYGIAKNLNFGFMYGGSWYTLQRQLQLEGNPITEDESRKLEQNYWKVYSGIPVFRRRLYNSCREVGYIKNICGRKFRIKNICSIDKVERGMAERQCINCFDAETEALTQRGWIKGFYLKSTDKFLTKNADTGELEWNGPLHRWFYPNYSGPAIRISNGGSLDVITTPEHRWLVTEQKTKKNVMKMSKELLDLPKNQSDYSIHLTGQYSQKWSAYSEDFAELAGWILTDGSYGKTYLNIAQTKPDFRVQIEALLKRSGFIHNMFTPKKLVMGKYQGSTQYNISGSIVQLFKSIFPKKVLTFEFVLALGDKTRQKLFETMMDGNSDRGWREQISPVFCAGTEEKADAFQFLCTTLGKASRKIYRAYKKKPANGSKGYWCVHLKARKTAQTSGIEYISKYKGGMWCVTVPNSYAVFRKNGMVFVSGNTLIQSSAAEWLKFALIRCGEDKQLRKWKCRMLMLIHDELVFEVPEKNAEKAAARIKELMEMPPERLIWEMVIPLTVSVSIGDSWGAKG